MKYIFAAAIIILVLFLLFRRENFANEQEKKAAISAWFRDPTKKKEYIQFRKDLNKNDKLEADIVDYQEAKNALH